ncbi:MAG: OstA-like protein [Bacteroidota bacterium]
MEHSENLTHIQIKNKITIFFCIGFIFFLIIFSNNSFSQAAIYSITPSADTNKTIEIINAKNLRQITINDSTILQTLSGNAKVKQGSTTLEGDSIVLNKRLGTAEVFGNVHINDADTVNTYSQYLKYIGNEQMAYLQNDVKLTDGRAKITTNNLEYNLKTGVAQYKNGGKVINDKTVLTSNEATYYSDTKDVLFINNVHLKDPKYNMTADSLRYNTAFKNAYFISPTHIISESGIIDTKSGNYNLETGEAVFFEKTIFRDSTRFISGNKVAFDEKSNMIQIEGNGKFVDSVNKIIVLGNQLLIDKKNSTFLATRKPVMILYQKDDSTYISADTLFSGRRTKDSDIVNQKDRTDTLKNTIHIDSDKKIKDSIRFFIGFHHVKIFNDSLQAISDSLHYSSEDSTFKLFGNPVCWNNNTQLSGDTMYLFTEKQQAKKLYVFNNAIVVNKTKEGLYNQMAGKTLNGFFKDGNIDYIRVKGTPAESIFYPQDDDSAYIGMNKSKGDVIDIIFVSKNINRIKFINDVDGTLYPMNQIPAAVRFLKNFNWQNQKRPKNKLELFE